jgi:hypothetical protein
LELNECKIKTESTGWGNSYHYPANEVAKRFCDLTSNKTLSKGDLEIIQSLGFTVVVAPNIHPDVAKFVSGK